MVIMNSAMVIALHSRLYLLSWKAFGSQKSLCKGKHWRITIYDLIEELLFTELIRRLGFP